MWRRRMLFQSRLPRVPDAITPPEPGRSDDRELGKKKTRKKRRNTDLNTDKIRKMRKIAGEDEVLDRISELPDSIIHHILNFLRCTKDVARTTVLSKNWKRVFDSYQSFHFDQRWFRMRKEVGFFDLETAGKKRYEEWDNFKGYVGNSLATRLDRLQCVDKFRLFAYGVDIQCIAGWIRAAIAKNVKELDVHVETCRNDALPINLTQSSSITFLKLTGHAMYSLASMKMCNLRGISIKEARYFDVNLMKKLEDNCPLLEDLRIVGCPQLSHLQISSLVKLKRVEVHDCEWAKRIEIAALNLETFWFHAKENQKCRIDLKCTQNLRNLTLKGSGMRDFAFEECISMSPLLEKLELRKCTRIEKLRICSHTLKSLALIQCSKLKEVDVNAPYLHFFEYDGPVMFFPFLNAPRLSQVKFSYRPPYKKRWEHFFWNLDGSKWFKLMVYTKETMKIFEEPSEANLIQVNARRIELIASTSKVVKNVDNWLRENHGKSLVVVSSSEGELLELINTLIIDREDNPSCCRFYSNKCWRHYIEDVKVTTMDAVEKTSYDFTWTPKIKKPSATMIDIFGCADE
ncbi:putative F-box/LRR-repeat protein At3g18150 [Salvia miltiorrhiza]|uniref:putative F-box/LRR-repeat protein At3g18150 n=1 Tax=Salvia miltiorrhiza TaxID=226208 RepID=UPI0025AD6C1C|nr:putative F-box/LRR-repeat protein At3g18150 [Salvia miltiorrhiza]